MSTNDMWLIGMPPTQLGTVSPINLNGNTSTFLSGNGSWATPSGTTGIYAPLVSGTSSGGLQLVGNPDNNLIMVEVTL